MVIFLFNPYSHATYLDHGEIYCDGEHNCGFREVGIIIGPISTTIHHSRPPAPDLVRCSCGSAEPTPHCDLVLPAPCLLPAIPSSSLPPSPSSSSFPLTSSPRAYIHIDDGTRELANSPTRPTSPAETRFPLGSGRLCLPNSRLI